MQVTNLNKVINFLLIGLISIGIIVLSFYQEIILLFKSASFIGDASQLFSNSAILTGITLFLFSLSFFIGLLVEGGAAISVQTFIVWGSSKRLFIRLFACSKGAKAFNYTLHEFNKLFKVNKTYNRINKYESHDNPLAVALFFKTANSQTLDWVIQHYSTYILATNYIFLLLFLGTPVLIIKFFSANFTLFVKIFISIIFITCIYLLFHLAIDRYLYTYETTYRQDILVLCDDTSKQKNAQVAQFTEH